MKEIHTTTDRETHGEMLVEKARQLLRQDARIARESESLDIRQENGVLTLTGKLSSFYLVQVVQHLLGQLEGIRGIRTDLDVTYTPRPQK